jgi:hypothetical protein
MSLTTDPNDPRLAHGVDEVPRPQAEVYLVLSEEERAKGFVRPYRDQYKHVGEKPKYPLTPLTEEQQMRFAGAGYVAFEKYPEEMKPQIGRYWTQAQLDRKGCGGVTTMGRALSETYARNPSFYGGTYCSQCGMHRPVAEFIWTADGEVVGS